MQDELAWTSGVQANEIGVAVKQGVVTLTGVADSYLARQAAEDAAFRVRGIRAAANNLEVQLYPAAERTDSDLAAAALNALTRDARIPTDRLMATITESPSNGG